jgi:hypothetical protein
VSVTRGDANQGAFRILSSARRRARRRRLPSAALAPPFSPSFQEQKISTDLQSLAIRLLDLADRAGQIAKGLDKQRTVRHGGRVDMVSVETPSRTASMPAPNAAAMVSVAQLGQACRDFRNAVESAIAALPKEQAS